jgi:hypothetical protein
MTTEPDQQAGSVYLDCTDADLEVIGDLLVRFTGDNALEDLALTWAKRGHALNSLHRLVIAVLSCSLREGHCDGVQKPFFVDRLLNEVERTGLHRPDCRRNVSVPRDDNDGQTNTACDEPRLHLQPVHIGHSKVQ